MAEIKSTLDIIMEKARGLTATEEEKAQFKRRELEEKVTKYLHKALNGAMDLERLTAQFAEFDKEERETAHEILLQQCLVGLDPEGDNKPVLEIMEQLLKVDTTPVRVILSDFRKTLEKGKRDLEAKLKKDLKRVGISGSAVVPNILAAPEWRRHVSELMEQFRIEIDAVGSKLKKIYCHSAV
jgi:hypothetical protein